VKVIETAFGAIKVLAPARFEDNRGFFSEVYSRAALREVGVDVVFVQDNHSLSVEAGVVRGLHFQLPPMAQAKLVRVVQGSILDVAVDIRKTSPTFGRHFCTTLSRSNWRQIYIPIGFAHGFATLEPNTEVTYKVSAPYAPEYERGINWSDPTLQIPWGIGTAEAIILPRDRTHPGLNDLKELFP
jgi:dTDP-4-dehydrorhamnose 3,5-epimerase